MMIDPTREPHPAVADDPQWRAAASRIADDAATKQDQYVDMTRRFAVRRALLALTTGDPQPDLVEARRAHALAILTDSVARQARISGLGRVVIPVEVAS